MKRFIFIVVSVLLMVSLVLPAASFAEQGSANAGAALTTAKPASAKVLINGKAVSFEAYNIGGSNYFKLRDIALAVNGTAKQFEVGWDSVRNRISLETGTAYTPVGGELARSAGSSAKQAKPANTGITLDGKELQLIAYNIGGNNYFKLRDLAGVLNIGVVWDEVAQTIRVETKLGYDAEATAASTGIEMLYDPRVAKLLPVQLIEDNAIFLGDSGVTLDYLKKYHQYYTDTLIPNMTKEFKSFADYKGRPVIIVTSTKESASQWTDRDVDNMYGVYNGKYILLVEHHYFNGVIINPILITHEFIHLVVDRVLAEGHSSVPMIINEGMAVNLSWSLYEEQTGWKNSAADQYWDKIYNSDSTVPDLWSKYESQWDVPVVDFLVKRYGAAKLTQYLEQINHNKNAFQAAYGITPTQFQKEFEQEVKRFRENPTTEEALPRILRTLEGKSSIGFLNEKIVGDYAYYTVAQPTGEQTFNLYQVDAKGQEKLVAANMYGDPKIIGDSVYFFTRWIDPEHKQPMKNSIHRVKLETGEDTLLLENEELDAIVDNHLYYLKVGSAWMLADIHRLSPNGADDTVVVKDMNGWALYTDEYIFYVEASGNAIHRVRLDGSGDTSIVEDSGIQQIREYKDGVLRYMIEDYTYKTIEVYSIAIQHIKS